MGYLCPMHTEIQRLSAGHCPKCHMTLVPDGIRFSLLRQMLGSPANVAVISAAMLALMVAAMMLLR